MAQGSNAYSIQPYRGDGEPWDQMNADSNGQLAYFSPENDEEDAMLVGWLVAGQGVWPNFRGPLAPATTAGVRASTPQEAPSKLSQ